MVERADIAGMTNAVREVFLTAGKDIEEKRTVMGSAFFTAGRAIGQFEARASVVRLRLWLPDRDRRTFEARPTFDADSGWLHIVSDDDIAFVRTTIPTAYRVAAGAQDAAPSAPRTVISATTPAWTVEPGPAPRRPAAAAPDAAKLGEKKKGAIRRPPTRI